MRLTQVTIKILRKSLKPALLQYFRSGTLNLRIKNVHHFKLLLVRIFVLLLVSITYTVRASDETDFAADNISDKQMIRTLEAYAVYKMGQHKEAFRRFLSLANDGNPQGMLNVANMYASGVGVQSDQEKAFLWYKKAALQGSEIGIAEIANRLESGLGVIPNSAAASKWRGKIQNSSEIKSTNNDSIDMSLARPLILRQLEILDFAAHSKDAEQLIKILDLDSEVFVVLPGLRSWTKLSRDELKIIWQTGFDQPGNYAYQRSDPEFILTSGDSVDVLFDINERWDNFENSSATQFKRVQINNYFTFSMKGKKLNLDLWKMHIRTSGDEN